MKVLLKFMLASVALAYSRIAYVRHFRVINKESVVGEALDPLNMVAAFAMYGFAALAALLFAIAAIIGIARQFTPPIREPKDA